MEEHERLKGIREAAEVVANGVSADDAYKIMVTTYEMGKANGAMQAMVEARAFVESQRP